MVGKLATWAWACLLKTALLGFGLHQDFATSYLDPKAPTQTYLSRDGCQIIVAVVGRQLKDLLSYHPADHFLKYVKFDCSQ